jgi:hypothetical protein
MSDQSFQVALAQGAGAAGLRQAAALIHALAPADRRWAVAQLPLQQRDVVESLLAELTAMGLPRERAIVEAALQQAPVHGVIEASSQPHGAMTGANGTSTADSTGVGSGVEPPSTGHPTSHPNPFDEASFTTAATVVDRWVSDQGVPALVRSLSSEPVALLARLLTLRDWAWRAEAVRHLPPALRQDVVEAMRLRVDSGTTNADHRLLDLLARRLETLRPLTATNSGPWSGPSVSSDTLGHAGWADSRSTLSRLLSRWRQRRRDR